MFPIIITVFLIIASSEAVIYRLNVTEYNKMPALYAMDDYELCMSSPDATYCVIDVDLLAGSNKKLMYMIQEYSEDTIKHFNHTQTHRGVCVTSTCKDFLENSTTNVTDLNGALEACLNKSLHSDYGLEGKLAKIQYCDKKDDEVEIDTSDLIVAVVYIVLIFGNVVGSFYDVLICKDEKSGNPFLLAFSLRRNWARLTASSCNPKEPRLERLKLFHGLRTMTMFCVIFSHTTLVMSLSYVANPLYIETAYDDILKQLLFNGSLVTHTFFIMSSFLLAYNFMLHTEKHSVSWMQLPKGILLRWLRLTPTYALVLATIVTWVRHAFRGPMWQLAVTSESVACRQYWWAQLLYINNYVYDDALCMPQTWYLASDTQLFIVGLLVCIVARSCRARAVTLSALMMLALAIVAAHTYFQDLEAVVIQSPESYRNLYATDNTFRLLYARGHTNMSTYILGLAGGFLAYHWQNGKDMNKYKVSVNVCGKWHLSRHPGLAGGFLAYHSQNGNDMNKYKKYRWAVWPIFPLGVAVILSGGLFYLDGSRAPMAFRVLYATFYKPVFQFLVITLILACVFRIESVYRSILEWRGFTWSGRVSYSAFLIHTLFHRTLVGSQMQLIYMSDYYVVTVLAASIFVTYLCAAILWLCVEAPAAQLVRAALAPSAQKRDLDDRTKV